MTKPLIVVTDGVAYLAKRTPLALSWVEIGPVPNRPQLSLRDELLQLLQSPALAAKTRAWCLRRLQRMTDAQVAGLMRRWRKAHGRR